MQFVRGPVVVGSCRKLSCDDTRSWSRTGELHDEGFDIVHVASFRHPPV